MTWIYKMQDLIFFAKNTKNIGEMLESTDLMIFDYAAVSG